MFSSSNDVYNLHLMLQDYRDEKDNNLYKQITYIQQSILFDWLMFQAIPKPSWPSLIASSNDPLSVSYELYAGRLS